MKVFIDVDVQNDFCLPEGALSVTGSPNELYRDLVHFAVKSQIPIVGSVDSHAFDAWEFASNPNAGPNGEEPHFPDHCVKGTSGWLKVEGTLPPRFRFLPNLAFAPDDQLKTRAITELLAGESQGLYFEKEVYSLFANPNAESMLADLERRAVLAGKGKLECIVFGVATDYCVRAAAVGLRQRGYGVVLLEDGCKGITAEGTQRALDEMREAGVRIRTSSAIFNDPEIVG